MALMRIIFVVAVAVVTKVSHGEMCNKTSDDLSFSDSLNAPMDFVRKGESESISCCANNFVGSVTWFREDGVGRRTRMSPSGRLVFQERSQVLVIHGVLMSDNGTYICVASDQSHNVTFRFKLIVLDCEKAVGKVTPIKIPPKVKYAAVGDTFTLECRGFFGCGMHIFMNAFWELTYENGTFIEYLKQNNSFYSVTQVSERDGMILGSRLTFKTVTEHNFTRKFNCVLYVPSFYLTYPVELKRKSTTKVVPYWVWVTIGCVVSLVGVSVLLLVLAYLWGSQVIFLIKTKTNCGWPQRRDEVDCDVCVMSSQESEPFVSENIYEVLKRNGYTVFYHYQEDSEGKLDVSVQMEGLTKSSHVLLFLSSEEEVEKIRQFFVQSCVNIHGGSKIIIIHKGPLTQSLKDLRPQIQAKLKIVKSIEWPRNEDADSREMKKFWCSVRLSLPAAGTTTWQQPHRSVSETSDRHASSSSNQPLLENDNNLEGDV